MIPDLAFVMLACARIGAVHSVVFAGFSANSLRDRIVDAQSKWVICADEGKRGGRTIGLKVIVDKAISESGGVVERCFMFHRTNNRKCPPPTLTSTWRRRCSPCGRTAPARRWIP